LFLELLLPHLKPPCPGRIGWYPFGFYMLAFTVSRVLTHTTYAIEYYQSKPQTISSSKHDHSLYGNLCFG